MPSSTGHAARLALAALLFTLATVPAAGAQPRTPAAPPTTPAGATAWTARPVAGGSGAGGTGKGAGRSYFYLEGPPGAVLQDRLSVTNPGTAPVTVRLRGVDTYRAEDGGRAVRDGGKPTAGSGGGSGGRAGNGAHVGVGAWLRTAAAKVVVPARTRAEVPFSVTVPTGSAPGERSGAIVAENGGRSVGVPVRLRVGGPTLAALTVEDVTVSGKAVHYTLVNRGNTLLVPRITVSADGVFGPLLRRGTRTLPVELAPGRSVTLTEPWRDAPALDSVTVRLRVTAAGGAHDEASARARFVSWAPLTGGALPLLAAAAAAAYTYRRRRGQRRPWGGRQRAGAPAPAPYEVGSPGRPPGGRRACDTRRLTKTGTGGES
ncbi:hypothetical protein ACFW5D_01475 [Streptomyces sp. NPDC058770]|uniref:hypothetical protein n=1 Tax=Streptomyces sp. NPDC058770 TaxID=3346631 RepID=UPI0036D1963B